jgi:uncharacterized protein (DUF433 family)
MWPCYACPLSAEPEPEPATEAIDPVGHIVRTPGVLGGRARIAGSRVRVSDIVLARYFHNYSAEEIVGEEVYPFLTLADVFAALAYYHDHKDEIEAEYEAGKQRYDERRRASSEQSVLRDE